MIFMGWYEMTPYSPCAVHPAELSFLVSVASQQHKPVPSLKRYTLLSVIQR